MKTNLLGKNVSKLNLKGSKILDKIKRKPSNIKYGVDIWNIYDFLYLNNKIPTLKVLEIKIPSSSAYIIESKSMKLYLNSFYRKSFKKEKDILKIMKNDIETLIKSKIDIKFIDKFAKEPSYIDLNTYKPKKIRRNKIIKFNGFRSICPVTSQPDFASIYIYSDVSISAEWLLEYLISFQNKGDFHEECIESIFIEISNTYNCKHLEVCGRFQRRGGIDINPIRANKNKFLVKNFREFNQ